MKMPGNMQNMMKQAQQMQQKLQEEIAQKQAELETRDYEASAGGGAITAVVTGKKELKSIKINPDVVDPEDIEMLEDLVVAAVNEAIRKAEEDSSGVMQQLTGGLSIPGLF
jgi:DNA-binding YbaB/EbfC family protein